MPTLSVTVERIPYPPATSDPDAWYILVTNHGTCKGKMAWRPQENEMLILEGDWAAYKGEREFSFKSARIDVPVAPRDQLHYVCLRTPGLGPAAEELIWERSGADWQSTPEGAIPRFSGKVFQAFQEQVTILATKTVEASIVATLIGKGATPNMACAAWQKWAEGTLGVVNADCFRLAELEGYGFKDVDRRIRAAYGIGDDDKRRIRAAVIYSLRRLTDAGDTLIEWESLYAQTVGLLGGYADLVSECTADLFDEGAIKAFPKSQGVSLANDFAAEVDVWEWVNGRTKTKEATDQ